MEAIFDGRGKREEGWGVRPEVPDGVARGLGLFERGVTRERELLERRWNFPQT